MSNRGDAERLPEALGCCLGRSGVATVDGNLDGAFAIEQQYSGIIKTNIVLDREIRDHYDLTVSVTDEVILE